MAANENEIAVIRTLIPDRELVFGPNDNEYMFTDDDIQNFYTAGASSVLRAAAYANFAIATSEALISKKIRTQDLQTDGAAIANALMIKGNALLAQADKVDKNAAMDYFDIIDFVKTHDGIELVESPFFDEYGNKRPGLESFGFGNGGFGF